MGYNINNDKLQIRNSTADTKFYNLEAVIAVEFIINLKESEKNN